MIRITILLRLGLLMAVLFVSVPSGAVQQPVEGPATKALANFLNEDCGVGEKGAALTALLRFKEELQPRLISVLRQGPNRQSLRQIEQALEQQWDARERFLETNPELGLSEENLRVLRGMNKQNYVEAGRTQFIRKQRENAAIALAAIASPRALEALSGVAREDESLRSVIRSAIAKYRRR